METSEKVNELITALASAKSNLPAFEKTASVNFGNVSFKYAPLEEIVNKLNPILSKNGLVFIQAIIENESGSYCATTIYHTNGQWIKTLTPFPEIKQGKIKELGANLTYIKRYSLCMSFGIAAEEDKDSKPIENNQQKFKNEKKPFVKSVKQNTFKIDKDQDKPKLDEILSEINKYLKVCCADLKDDYSKIEFLRKNFEINSYTQFKEMSKDRLLVCLAFLKNYKKDHWPDVDINNINKAM